MLRIATSRPLLLVGLTLATLAVAGAPMSGLAAGRYANPSSS